MSAFAYFKLETSGRNIQTVRKWAQTILQAWNEEQIEGIRAELLDAPPGLLIEVKEGQDSFWYALQKQKEQERLQVLVQLARQLRCLEVPMSLNLGMAKDLENELTAARSEVKVADCSALLDLTKQQLKQNVRLQLKTFHLFHMSESEVKVGRLLNGPDGQPVAGYYSNFWVVAVDQESVWQILTQNLSADGDSCVAVESITQMPFPDDYDGTDIWFDQRVFFSK